MEIIPLWVVECDAVAHGPYWSVSDAWAAACALRRYPLHRARDLHLVHARDGEESLTAPRWDPRCD
jgi:hypothetical protein